MDSDDRVHVSYYDSLNLDLKYAIKASSGPWVSMGACNRPEGSGGHSSIVVEYSPPIADCVRDHGWPRTVVRTLLLPVIGFVSLFV